MIPMPVTERTCQAVKAQFTKELDFIVSKSLLSEREFGFAVCSQNQRLYSGEVTNGTRNGVLIPTCPNGSTLGSVHSHAISPAIHYKFGRRLSHLYHSAPSSTDLASAARTNLGCVITSKLLTCYQGSVEGAEELKPFEDGANEAFQRWGRGEMSDNQFRKVVERTVRAQMKAMSRGGFCRVPLTTPT